MEANLNALPLCLKLANEIEDIASKATIIANHLIYLVSIPLPIKLEIASEDKKTNITKRVEEINSDIKAVLYTTFTSFSFLENLKKAVSKP